MEKGYRYARWEAPVVLTSCLAGLVLSTAKVINFEQKVSKVQPINLGQSRVARIETDQNLHYYPDSYAIKPEEDEFVEDWRNSRVYKI